MPPVVGTPGTNIQPPAAGKNFAGLGRIKPGQHVGEGGLAGARCAAHTQQFAGHQREREVGQSPGAIARAGMTIGHMPKQDRPLRTEALDEEACQDAAEVVERPGVVGGEANANNVA